MFDNLAPLEIIPCSFGSKPRADIDETYRSGSKFSAARFKISQDEFVTEGKGWRGRERGVGEESATSSLRVPLTNSSGSVGGSTRAATIRHAAESALMGRWGKEGRGREKRERAVADCNLGTEFQRCSSGISDYALLENSAWLP